MIVLLDTSTAVCKLWLYDNSVELLHDEWQADRSLAEGIFTYLESQFARVNKTWIDIDGLGVFRGPGSFTGLRIGMAVLNTIAADRQIPIAGATGDEWRTICLTELLAGHDQRIVLPEYGREARITTPRK